MCLLKQGNNDMNHAAGFITRACRMADEDYGQGVLAAYQKTVAVYQPIVERDLGGFFAAVGLHTEGYPAWTNLSGGTAIADPVIGVRSLKEIEEEAWRLDFLLPAIEKWLHVGTPDEIDRGKRQLVQDDETVLEGVLKPAHRNAEDFAVDLLDDDLRHHALVGVRRDLARRRRPPTGRAGRPASGSPGIDARGSPARARRDGRSLRSHRADDGHRLPPTGFSVVLAASCERSTTECQPPQPWSSQR